MKMMVILGTLVLMTGCVTLTSAGEHVRYTINPQATVNCKFLGNVKGQYDNDLRNEAAKLGANMVFNVTLHNAAWSSRAPDEIHIWQHGEAYFCPDPVAKKQ